MELVDGALDAPADRAVVIRPKGNSDDVEARAVVPFEQAGDQVCDRVPAKVARDVCESDPAGLTAPAGRRQPGPDGNFSRGELSCAGKSTRRVDGQLQKDMGRHD